MGILSRKFFCLSIGIFLLMLSGCGKKKLHAQEYLNELNKSDYPFNQKLIQGDFTIACHIRTPESIVIEEILKNNGQFQKEDYNTQLAEASKIIHLRISFKSNLQKDFLKPASKSEGDYFGLLEYFTLGFPTDLHVKSGSKELPLAYYHFERNYGLGSESYALIGLEGELNDIEINGLSVFWNTKQLPFQPLTFLYSKDVFSNLPTPIIDFES